MRGLDNSKQASRNYHIYFLLHTEVSPLCLSVRHKAASPFPFRVRFFFFTPAYPLYYLEGFFFAGGGSCSTWPITIFCCCVFYIYNHFYSFPHLTALAGALIAQQLFEPNLLSCNHKFVAVFVVRFPRTACDPMDEMPSYARCLRPES